MHKCHTPITSFYDSFAFLSVLYMCLVSVLLQFLCEALEDSCYRIRNHDKGIYVFDREAGPKQSWIMDLTVRACRSALQVITTIQDN